MIDLRSIAKAIALRRALPALLTIVGMGAVLFLSTPTEAKTDRDDRREIRLLERQVKALESISKSLVKTAKCR